MTVKSVDIVYDISIVVRITQTAGATLADTNIVLGGTDIEGANSTVGLHRPVHHACRLGIGQDASDMWYKIVISQTHLYHCTTVRGKVRERAQNGDLATFII